MSLFKKKPKSSIGQLQIEKLYTQPRDQLMALQRRFDYLQELDLKLSTHVGELKLNADGDIKEIDLMMEKIKLDMVDMKERIIKIHQNLDYLVNDLNLTTRASDLDKFSDDLKRIKPFNFVTVSQFEKIVRDYLDENL